MTHETALTILEALSEDEKERFYKKLGIVKPKLGKPNKAQKHYYADYIHSFMKRVQEKNRIDK